MTFRRNRFIGNVLVVLGVILLLVGVLMPNYKIPQRLVGIGPRLPDASQRAYTITTYITPPIDKGTPVNLNFLSDRPGATVILLAPFDPQEQTIEIPPVINTVFSSNQKGLVIYTTATKTAPYLLMITSYNSSFQFYLDSVWSPFYDLRAATTFGLFTLPFGLVVLYYDDIVERRERMFEEALNDIRNR